jgi:hypothetical protein
MREAAAWPDVWALLADVADRFHLLRCRMVCVRVLLCAEMLVIDAYRTRS